jgi:hypothetical protein
MNEDVLNLAIRRFLKQFGVTSQRELERAVAAAVEQRRLTGAETLKARAVLHVEGLGELAVVEGDIPLQ